MRPVPQAAGAPPVRVPGRRRSHRGPRLEALRAVLLAAGALALAAAPASASAPADRQAAAPVSASPAPGAGGAGDPSQTQLDRAVQAESELAATRDALVQAIVAARGQQDNLLALIETNRTAIVTILGQMAEAEHRYQDATLHAAQAQADADRARRDQAADREALRGWVRSRYEGEDGFVTYLVQSDSFTQLIDRASVLTHLTDRGDALIKQLRRDADRLDIARHDAQKEAAAAEESSLALAAQRDALTREIEREHQIFDQLDDKTRAAAAEIAATDSQSSDVARRVADLRIQQLDEVIAAAEQAAWDAAQLYAQNHLLGLPSGTPVNLPVVGAGQFVWPARGVTLTQPFGPSPYPFEPSAFGYPHFHTGVDLAGPMGTPVYATGPGVVLAADASSVGYGNHVILAHDARTRSLYGHLETMVVQPGQSVAAGQLIGLMGSTGNSTGPHCHFELRVDGVPVDPVPFLSGPAPPPGA